MGSIPIARSTPRQRRATQGYKIVDPGPSLYLELSLRCPSIHTYSHTRQLPKIICVIS
jgi:hypothetical protein